jgi:hypothetical protein
VFKSFIPKEYRYLLDYISPGAFEVVDWKKAVMQFVSMSKLALDRDFLQGLATFNTQFVLLDILVKSEGSKEGVKPVELDLTFPEQVLDVYFSQLFSNRGLFIDLRDKNFSVINGSICWSPGGFVHVFDETFRLGMLAIYEGYYFDKFDQLKAGMRAVGLIQSDDPSEVNAISGLLFAHFKKADAGPVLFEMSAFQNSFHELFLHLKRNNLRLTSDFIFLGIYLVTLYLSLSHVSKAFDVSRIFRKVWQRNSARA